MTEPIRHQSSERNRRKLIKLAGDLLEELNHICDQQLHERRNLEYAIGRAHRILNRLRAEVEQDDPSS